MDNTSNASNTSGGQVGRIGGADDDSNMSADGDDLSNDAEGVWSADIEQSFQEALAIYPPCGRRKIILSDEGKMYGRNELIARYIKLRTGKMRSRKQVSSHIQVMARRKAKEIQAQLKDQGTREWVVQSMAAMSSAQIVSAAALRAKTPASSAVLTNNITVTGLQSTHNNLQQPWSSNAVTHDVKPVYGIPSSCLGSSVGTVKPETGEIHLAWVGRSIAGPRLRMVEFCAFLEQQLHPDTDSYHKHLFVHIGSNVTYADPLLEAVDIRQIADKFPDKRGGLKELYDKGPQAAFFLVKFWADINVSVQSEAGNFYGVSCLFESTADMTIQCSTKVCSFGKQVVEKVETEYSHVENGRYVYRIHRSPMCEYMINFILKLKQLPEKYMMNSVLENFTVLQVVVNRDTNETLLCIAYVFEVSTSEHGAQHHIYRLVRD